MVAGNILVADDDTAIRTVLSQALSRAGYEVRTTGNAATLWRWVQSGEGDLVITDVVMPDENAFELLPKMKKLRPDLPIIVMSAQNTFMTAIKASSAALMIICRSPSTCGNWYLSSGARCPSRKIAFVRRRMPTSTGCPSWGAPPPCRKFTVPWRV